MPGFPSNDFVMRLIDVLNEVGLGAELIELAELRNEYE